jgi:methionyl-tRNA formyltransferase
MRIVVMGTGAFAVPMFAAILQAGHTVPALVTRPVPPATGRKKELAHPNPMRDFAEAQGIPVHAPDTTNTEPARELLRSLQPELFVVCDFGEILGNETLSIAPLGGINLHASLLPKYRGAAPINWAILRGETETGVSVIHMTPKLDGGPILAVKSTLIGTDETTAELEPRLAQLGIEPVLHSIEQLSTWDRVTPLGTLQDASGVTSARRLRKTDGNVIWSRSASRIRNQVRGLKPWPGVFTHWFKPNAAPVRLILDRVSLVSAEPETKLQPGCIALADGERLWVQTGAGLLSLDAVQPAGKRVMEIREFLRGNTVLTGQQLGEA